MRCVLCCIMKYSRRSYLACYGTTIISMVRQPFHSTDLCFGFLSVLSLPVGVKHFLAVKNVHSLHSLGIKQQPFSRNSKNSPKIIYGAKNKELLAIFARAVVVISCF